MTALRRKAIFIAGLLLLGSTLPPFFANAQNVEIGFFIGGNRKQVSIPFENHNNLIVIDVILNNRLPLKFILDTGLKSALITDKIYSDLLDINYSRVIPIVGVDGRVLIDAYVANNVTLSMPGLTGRGQTVLALAEDFLQLRTFMGIDVHGIIGYELFNRFIVQIDYDYNMITFYEPDHFQAPKGFTRHDMQIIQSKPFVKAQVLQKNGTLLDGLFLLDTGASLALALDKEAGEEIYLPEKKLEATLGRSIGGDVEGYLSRTSSLTFGSLEFKDVLTSYPEQGEYAELLKVPGRLGSIGGTVFSRTGIIFDYFQQKIYLRKGMQYKRKFEFNMSGLEFTSSGSDLRTFVVKSVMANSPASAAGIQKDDKLVSINGVPTRFYRLSQISQLLRSREGRKVRLRFEREGKLYNHTIRLKRVI